MSTPTQITTMFRCGHQQTNPPTPKPSSIWSLLSSFSVSPPPQTTYQQSPALCPTCATIILDQCQTFATLQSKLSKKAALALKNQKTVRLVPPSQGVYETIAASILPGDKGTIETLRNVQKVARDRLSVVRDREEQEEKKQVYAQRDLERAFEFWVNVHRGHVGSLRGKGEERGCGPLFCRECQKMEIALVAPMKEIEGDPWGARGPQPSSQNSGGAECTEESAVKEPPEILVVQQELESGNTTTVSAEAAMNEGSPIETPAEVAIEAPVETQPATSPIEEIETKHERIATAFQNQKEEDLPLEIRTEFPKPPATTASQDALPEVRLQKEESDPRTNTEDPEDSVTNDDSLKMEFGDTNLESLDQSPILAGPIILGLAIRLKGDNIQETSAADQVIEDGENASIAAPPNEDSSYLTLDTKPELLPSETSHPTRGQKLERFPFSILATQFPPLPLQEQDELHTLNMLPVLFDFSVEQSGVDREDNTPRPKTSHGEDDQSRLEISEPHLQQNYDWVYNSPAEALDPDHPLPEPLSRVFPYASEQASSDYYSTNSQSFLEQIERIREFYCIPSDINITSIPDFVDGVLGRGNWGRDFHYHPYPPRHLTPCHITRITLKLEIERNFGFISSDIVDVVLKGEMMKLYDSIVWEDPRKSLWEAASMSSWEEDRDDEEHICDVKDVDEDAEEMRKARVEEFLEKQRAEMLEGDDQQDTAISPSIPIEAPPAPPSKEKLETPMPPGVTSRDELDPLEELFPLSPDDEHVEPEAVPSKLAEHPKEDFDSKSSDLEDAFDETDPANYELPLPDIVENASLDPFWHLTVSRESLSNHLIAQGMYKLVPIPRPGQLMMKFNWKRYKERMSSKKGNEEPQPRGLSGLRYSTNLDQEDNFREDFSSISRETPPYPIDAADMIKSLSAKLAILEALIRPGSPVSV